MAQQSREYPSELDQLAAMRAFILTECRRAWTGHAEETLDQLLLAVHEAATNIIRHGYQDEGGRPIRLHLEIESDRVHLWFFYPGRQFDPAQVAPPVFDGTREGGFGVYLIRQLVDEVYYTRDSAGLCSIHLIKKRNPLSPQEHHVCN
jgi:anti-sigma regulatory factor (Ser/Thr protein kinase)